MPGKTILETDRLIVREFDEGDVEPFYLMGSDPEVIRYTGDPPGGLTGLDHAREVLRSRPLADYQKYGYGRWACVLKATGEVIGFAGLKYLPDKQEIDLGYRLLPPYWGQGFATEASRAVLDYGRTRLGIGRVIAMVDPANTASIRVVEKLGLMPDGQDESAGRWFLKYVTPAGPPTVTLDLVADLSEADRAEVRELGLAVYPPGHFDDWPGRHLEWSTPEWCVRVRDASGALATYVGVYVRDATWDGRPVRVGGVGNVKTHPAARGQGFAGLGVRRAVEFFGGRPGVGFALLVCEPELVGFYARLGWREFGGQLLVRQRRLTTEFTLDRVMTHAVETDGPASATLDLCGPPW